MESGIVLVTLKIHTLNERVSELSALPAEDNIGRGHMQMCCLCIK